MHVQYFLSSCFERDFSPTTISSYCSGIIIFHNIYHLPDPTNTFIVQSCLKYAGGHKSRMKTEEMLNDICGKLKVRILIKLV